MFGVVPQTALRPVDIKGFVAMKSFSSGTGRGNCLTTHDVAQVLKRVPRLRGGHLLRPLRRAGMKGLPWPM